MSLKESESWVQFLVISVYFCQLRIKYHVIRASAETCYECLRGENKQKLEVLSFEKAWDKIEKDIFRYRAVSAAKTANTSRSLGWEIHDKSVIYSHKKSEKISHRDCADSARRALPAQTKINVVSDPAAYFPKQIFDHRPLCCCLLGCGLWSKIIN